MSNKILCMEIGTSSVRLAEVMRKKDTLTILDTYVFDTPDDATKDGKVRMSDTIVASIKNGIEESGFTSNEVCFVVESSKILFKQVELPFVQKKLIQGMLTTQFSDIFPVDELLYHISYAYKNTYEKNGKKMMLLDVFAVPNDLSESYYNLAIALNLSVRGLSIAGYNMINLAPEIFKGRNIATVNVGENYSTLTVAVDKNIVFNKTIPVGIMSVIQQIINSPLTMDNIDITGACELLYSQNILLPKTPTKSNENESEQDKIRRITTMSIVSFAQQIETAFAAFLSKENIHIQEFHLTGLGAGFAGISQLLTYIFGITVTVIQKYSKIDIGEKAAGDTLLISCYPCVSGVLSSINLFTSEEKSRSDVAKKEKIDKICAIIAIITCFSSICYGSYSWLQIGITKQDAMDENQRLNKHIQELRDLGVEHAYEEYSSAETKNKEIQAIYDSTKSGNEDVTSFLNELEVTIPSSARATSVTLSPKNADVSFACDNKFTAANALNRLRNMKTAKDMKCDGISEDSASGKISFTCTFTLVPTAERKPVESDNTTNTNEIDSNLNEVENYLNGDDIINSDEEE